MLPPMRELFAHRRFMIFWLGQTVSVVGNGMVIVATAALVLPYYGATGIGAVLASESAIFGLALLGGGVIADRLSRSRVMAVGDVLRLGGTIGMLLLLGRAPLGVICLLGGLIGLGAALFQPAYKASISQLLPDELLVKASSLQGAANRGASMLGAALAGVLVATVGARIAFVVDGATYVVSIITLVAIRLPAVQRTLAAKSPWRAALNDAKEGLIAVWRVPWAAVVMAQGTIQVVIGFAPVLVLLPVVSTERYGGGAYGLLTALMGAGSILGSLLVTRVRTAKIGWPAMHGVAAFGVVCLCIAINVPLWLFAIAQIAAWSGIGLFTGLWFPALQREFPDEVQGRVFALESLATFALEPVGLVLAPLAAAAYGNAAIGLFTAAVVVSTSYLVFLIPGVAYLATGHPPRPAGGISGRLEPPLAPGVPVAGPSA
jgi:MFS family permease